MIRIWKADAEKDELNEEGKRNEINKIIHKDIFACLFSIHNTISLSCHEQVCLSVILVHDM